MDSYEFIGENIDRLRERVARAAGRAGRDPEDIAILAVTKFHPIEAAERAYACGMRRFGENRVQEALGKFSAERRAAMPGCSVDLLGALQSNKINKAIDFFDGIQSVDSADLLDALCAKAGRRSAPLSLMLELHTGEDSKSGFPDEDSLLLAAERFLLWKDAGAATDASPPGVAGGASAAGRGMLRLAGLMTMAPYTTDRDEVRGAFRRLAAAAAKIRQRFGLGVAEFGTLSMGMSGDYEIAVEEGSTLLRIGTAIFGERR
ncbi:YggS family pyridoxal phosphate enzyme [bacterium]|nr:YggS family pyridoxal phosphate enzyme [bacterium]